MEIEKLDLIQILGILQTVSLIQNTKYKILGAQGIKMFKQSNTSEWD